MRFDPHDLIRLRGTNALVGDVHAVARVRAALSRTPWAFVRRVPIRNGLIPISVPSIDRNESIAAHVAFRDVERRVTPEALGNRHFNIAPERLAAVPALSALSRLRIVLDGYAWGPTGRLAFEMVTGVALVPPESALDLMLRCARAIPPTQALELHLAIARAAFPARTNVMIELPRGCVSLADIAMMAGHVSLYTVHGPQIVSQDDLFA